jgi:CDP-glucose 4,6-dehydratase
MVTSAYAKSFFSAPDAASIATVRAGNVIGGGDWADHRLIPDCIRDLERGRQVTIRSPEAVRPWQHVLEPLYGYLCLAARQWSEPPVFAGAWNFGPRSTGRLTVGDVATLAVSVWGSGSWRAGEQPSGASSPPREARLLTLDTSKAQSLLGWQSRYDDATAVAKAVEWYRRRRDIGGEFDARRACLQEIADYEADARPTGRPKRRGRRVVE